MKKLVFIALIMCVSIVSFSISVSDFFKSAEIKSSDFDLISMQFEIDKMEYEKAKIESVNAKTDLLADVSLLNAQSRFNSSLKSFYGDSARKLLSFITEEIALSVCNLQLKYSTIDYENKQKLFEKKLISKNDLFASKISFEDAKTSLENKKPEYEYAKNDLAKIFEGNIKDIEFKIYDAKNVFLPDKAFMDKNLQVKILEKLAGVAEYELTNMNSDVSGYDVKIAEMKEKQSKLNYENTKETLPNTNKNMKNAISSAVNNLDNIKEKISMKETDYKETEERYKKKLITESELIRNKIDYLNIQKSYYETLKNYYISMINYIIDTGRNMGEVMN